MYKCHVILGSYKHDLQHYTIQVGLPFSMQKLKPSFLQIWHRWIFNFSPIQVHHLVDAFTCFPKMSSTSKSTVKNSRNGWMKFENQNFIQLYLLHTMSNVQVPHHSRLLWVWPMMPCHWNGNALFYAKVCLPSILLWTL